MCFRWLIDSSFKGVLNIADTVTAVNGKTFDNSADLIKYVQGLKLGSKVKVTYTTDDKEKTATGKIIKIANGKKWYWYRFDRSYRGQES